MPPDLQYSEWKFCVQMWSLFGGFNEHITQVLFATKLVLSSVVTMALIRNVSWRKAALDIKE